MVSKSNSSEKINSKLLDVTTLEYLNFSTSCPGQYLNECNHAYELWKQQWTDTFAELGVKKTLTSEDFLNRQICGLFKDGKAIGFLLHHELNLNLSSALDSNYFQSYPSSLKDYQKTKNDNVFIVSYMTTNPDWRKSKTNYSISELLLSFAVIEFSFTKSNRILGYFRNNRSINNVFYRHSGRYLCTEIAHNIEVDFGEIYQTEASLSEYKDHAVVSLKLWENFYNKKQMEKNNGTQKHIGKSEAKFSRRKLSRPELERQEFL